jgi:hypothetical protein
MATVNVTVVLPAAVFFVIALAGIWFIGYLFRGLRPNASDEPREQNLLTVAHVLPSGPSEPVWWPTGATEGRVSHSTRVTFRIAPPDRRDRPCRTRVAFTAASSARCGGGSVLTTGPTLERVGSDMSEYRRHHSL